MEVPVEKLFLSRRTSNSTVGKAVGGKNQKRGTLKHSSRHNYSPAT